MKFKLNRLTSLMAIATVAATTALAVPAVKSQGQNTVKIDGSSTVYPITEAVAEEFQKTKKGAVKVTVGISGTGGGFKKFCAGETDISNASRPIKKEEIEACKSKGIEYVELPVAYDALTVVVHKDNKWADKMTKDELKKMWEPAAQGKITNWSQVRSGWPNAPLKLFGPGADSGTFDYFTEVINGKAQASRTDYTPSEDDNVLVQGVSRDKNAIGYFGLAYYEANKSRLKAVPIVNDKGTAVYPTVESVNNGTYKPLSRPIYIYVKKAAAQRPEVKEFVDYYLNNAPKLVAEVKYVPLPNNDYSKAKERFAKLETGRVALRDGL